MASTDTRYAKTGDGIQLAYRTFGSGSDEVLMMSGELISIDTMAGEPGYAGCLERLASFSRVVCFDQRCVGLSDPAPLGAPPTVEQWARDALSVLDAASSESATVFAATDAGMAAMLLAATHPERVTRLVLFNAYARSLWASDFPWGHEPTAYESAADAVTDTSTTGGELDFLSLLGPSVYRDEGFRQWWDSAGHRGASPGVARSIWDAYGRTDVRPALSTIHVPTLVLHRADNAWTKVDHGRYIADRIEKARFVSLPGADDLWWVGDTDDLLAELAQAGCCRVCGRQLTDVVSAERGIGPDRWSKHGLTRPRTAEPERLGDRLHASIGLPVDAERGGTGSPKAAGPTDGLLAALVLERNVHLGTIGPHLPVLDLQVELGHLGDTQIPQRMRSQFDGG